MSKNQKHNLTETEVNTILCLAKNGLVPNRVARELNYMRNSVTYQIGRIRMKTGLNPRDFYDMVKLLELIGGNLHDRVPLEGAK